MKYTTFKIINTLFIPVFFILVISALSGCATKADPYKEELSAELFFQKAHEASDAGEFGIAIDYYTAYQQKFPNEIKGNLWATFEISFIHHRQGNNEEALKLFQALLEKYDSPAAENYPQAPKILTEKVLAGIKNAMKNLFSPSPTPVPEPEKTP